MHESIHHTIIVDRSCHIVGRGFHIVAGISHCHTRAGTADDGYVVATVTESHGLRNVETKMPGHSGEAFPFVSTVGRDIGEGRMPSCRHAMTDALHQLLFVLRRTERRHLKHIATEHFTGRTLKVKVANVEFATEYSVYSLAGLAIYGYTLVTAHNTRIPFGHGLSRKRTNIGRG